MHNIIDPQPTTPKVTSLEEFYRVLKKQLSLLKKVESLPNEECSLCSSSKLDVLKIVRSCKISPYPCERHECSCFIPVSLPCGSPTHCPTPPKTIAKLLPEPLPVLPSSFSSSSSSSSPSSSPSPPSPSILPSPSPSPSTSSPSSTLPLPPSLPPEKTNGDLGSYNQVTYEHNEKTIQNNTTAPPSSPNNDDKTPINSSSPLGSKIFHVFPACAQCLANILYTKTNNFMREHGRWRGNCPFCKAEFCHLDLVLLSPTAVPTKPPPSTAKTKKKRNNK